MVLTLVRELGAQQVKFARLTEIASGSVYSQQAKSSQRLLLYPLAFIIFWIPATTNRYSSPSVCVCVCGGACACACACAVMACVYLTLTSPQEYWRRPGTRCSR
jgi:hypothetical protein